MFKLNTSILFFLIISSTSQAQDWQLYNDTLNYYYIASNTEDIFTLRTKDKLFSETDSVIWFADNYIPLNADDEFYYENNGSVWGDSISFSGDSLFMDEDHLFINNQLIGESWDWNESIEITFTHISDTVIFDLPDSVRYYNLSDGNRIIQSKKYGLIEFPRLFPETLIIYNLVGIEYVIGLQFDNHNLIFDYENDDRLIYQAHYFHFEEEWVENYYNYEVIEVSVKTLINGHYFYNFYPIYYPYHPDSNEIYDRPGERVKKMRILHFLFDSFDDVFAIDEYENFSTKLGWNSDTTDDGRYVQCIGFSEFPDDYSTFGEPFDYFINTDLTYYGNDTCNINHWGNVWCTFEEGFGMTHYCESGVESFYRIDLIGVVKSGVEIGPYFELGLDENSENEQIIAYPNPSNGIVFFNSELSNVSLFNAQGKEVVHINQTIASIDISDLPFGLYYVKAINQNDNAVQIVVVKK